MANIIRSREHGQGEFNATSKQICFKCMEKGDRFVFIYGRRKFACKTHFQEWVAAGQKMGDKLLSGEG